MGTFECRRGGIARCGMFSRWDRLFGNYVDEPEPGHDGMMIGLREFRTLRYIEMSGMLMNPLLETPVGRVSTFRV